MFTESGGRSGSSIRGETNTGEKVSPALIQLTKARCSEDNKHAGDEKEPSVKTFHSHYHTSDIKPYACQTLVYTFGRTALL